MAEDASGLLTKPDRASAGRGAVARGAAGQQGGGLSRNITRSRLIQIGELRVDRRKPGEPDDPDAAAGELPVFAIAI